jgi:hypothetical protein
MSSPLKRHEKRYWLHCFAEALGNETKFVIGGSVGICRECVGLLSNEQFLDYDEAAPIGVGAYHKHPCLAVLLSETNDSIDEAIDALYDWCKKLENAGYTKCHTKAIDPHCIGVITGQTSTPYIGKR